MDIPIQPCPWCTEPVVRKVYGLHTKTFCNSDCRTSYHNGLAWMGKLFARCASEPGLLRATMDAVSTADVPSLTTPERAISPSRVSGCPEK